MMRRRGRLLAWGLGLGYLALVSAGAWTSFLYSLVGRPKTLVYAGMDFVGANNDFGFFAPAVSSQVQAQVTLRDAQGRATNYDFSAGNREIGFRLNSIVTLSMRRPVLRDVCVRSWAAALLGNCPEARQVTVVARYYRVPTMRQYRAGQRPTWVPFYEGTFERTAAPPAAL